MAEPVRKPGWPEARVITGSEAAIVDRGAVVERRRIGDDGAGVARGVQELPNELDDVATTDLQFAVTAVGGHGVDSVAGPEQGSGEVEALHGRRCSMVVRPQSGRAWWSAGHVEQSAA